MEKGHHAPFLLALSFFNFKLKPDSRFRLEFIAGVTKVTGRTTRLQFF
ncbi:hypothetical protein JCM19233_2231 [Vibrio astriarenae]|nr:hypothetical protein JCM19233_2231 [Vibrio sp. C7]